VADFEPEAGGTRIVGRVSRLGARVFNATFVVLAVMMAAFAIGIAVADGAANPGFVICTIAALLFGLVGAGLLALAPMTHTIEKHELTGSLLRLFEPGAP
jgi:hypothetical protein